MHRTPADSGGSLHHKPRSVHSIRESYVPVTCVATVSPDIIMLPLTPEHLYKRVNENS